MSTVPDVKLCECGCGQPAPIATRTERGGPKRGQPRRFVLHHHLPQHNKRMGGPAHPFWKGDEVSYVNLHEWVRRHKEKKGVCEYCGREGKTHFANRSGLYHRDLTDYRELCSSCHKKFDGTT